MSTKFEKDRATFAPLAAKLADLACDVDALRKDFKTAPEWHETLTQAVDMLHGVAMECDDAFGLGIYAYGNNEPEGEAA